MTDNGRKLHDPRTRGQRASIAILLALVCALSGSATLSADFRLPVILSVQPPQDGTTLAIQGQNFPAAPSVYLGVQPLQVVSNTPTGVWAAIPVRQLVTVTPGATYDVIVGAGGTGGVPSVCTFGAPCATPGSGGAQSEFALNGTALVTAAGGGGGGFGTQSVGLGGAVAPNTGVSGNPGQAGTAGQQTHSPTQAGQLPSAIGGAGGTGGAAVISNQAPGANGQTGGVGGAGATGGSVFVDIFGGTGLNAGVGRTGATGGAGLIAITW